MYCLPCFQKEIKDLKAVILEMKNHETDLREMFAPPADPQVTTPPADLEPRSLATASARRTLELYRRLQYRVRKRQVGEIRSALGAPAGAVAHHLVPPIISSE